MFLALLLCLFLAAFSPPNSESQAAPSSPAPPPAKAAAPTKAKQAPEARPASDGSPVEVSATLDKAKRHVRVVVTAFESMPASVLVLYRYQGAEDDKASTPSKASLPALSAGERAVRTLAVGEPLVGDVGLSPAVEVGGQTTGSDFIAVRGTSGRVVTAATLDTLDEAELNADYKAGRVSEREFHTRTIELDAVPGSEKSTVLDDPSLAAGTVAVSGTARYPYLDSTSPDDQLAARGARVQLRNTETGELGPGSRVGNNGSFSITGSIPRDGDEWAVELTADAGVAVVYDPSRSGYHTITSTATRVLNSGSSWTGVDLNAKVATDEGRAFAILDAAKTVGDFYTPRRRDGWTSTFEFSYPQESSATDKWTNLISIEGGIALHCGGEECEEDAFDWDVVAHETGHVVANEAGMNESPGWSHNGCDDAWTGSRSKEDAAKLAWSEGWATFWGLVALRDQGVPSGLPATIGDNFYDDRTGPPYFVGPHISYSLESAGHCDAEARGNTSEYAVQLALWDFWDSGSDHGETTDWTTTAIFNRLWDAKPTTFWAAWQAISSGWTTAQRRSAQIILTEAGFAPSVLTPDHDTTRRCPPKVSWGHGGSSLNPNVNLTLRVTSPSGALLKSVAVAWAGNTTYSYSFSLNEWRSWSSNYGEVWIEIDGRQLGTPDYGPYRSRAVRVVLANPPNVDGCVIDTDWRESDWASYFTADRAWQRPATQIDFAGHPLDVTFDNTGAIWGIGEFGLQTTRTDGGALSRHNLPIKVYLKGDSDDPNDDPDIWDWTKPFSSAFFPHASGSDLAESIISAGPNVWAAYGGEQDHTEADNHSILARYPTDDPHNFWKACAVPLPGDNNEVIGLAYDSNRDRVWFAESEGDHRQGSGKYTTIGWVKASGLGSRCQNELDFGGRPAPVTDAENDAMRASAQQTVNSLQCTASQESDPAANCVHIIGGTGIPSGGTHLEYDASSDALWMTNWCDRKLRKYSIGSGTWATFNPPPPVDGSGTICPKGVAWQIAANSTHIFFNEYEGNRVLRFAKSSGEWSIIEIPVPQWYLQVHSITLSGNRLWFTVSDEDYNSNTKIGYIELDKWDSGAAGVIYNGWGSLSMRADQKPGNKHSFRGIDIGPGGKVALADHGDMATVILTPK